MQRDSCEESLAVVRDANQQALVATALLEDKIDRLSCSLSAKVTNAPAVANTLAATGEDHRL